VTHGKVTFVSPLVHICSEIIRLMVDLVTWWWKCLLNSTTNLLMLMSGFCWIARLAHSSGGRPDLWTSETTLVFRNLWMKFEMACVLGIKWYPSAPNFFLWQGLQLFAGPCTFTILTRILQGILYLVNKSMAAIQGPNYYCRKSFGGWAVIKVVKALRKS
jgi:hypothetical protein